jgi:GC-rich sequence DNA-binding factor
MSKFPKLERLEEEHVSILKERSDMVSQRRQADDEDDLTIFLGTLPRTAEAEVDELGRVNPRANPDAARRDRRLARVGRRNLRRIRAKTSTIEEEGYSTDASLSPADATDYATAMRKLGDSSVAIFSDVQANEFKDPMLGLGKWFGEWRSKYDDNYTGAWGGLNLVVAWEFWVRLELMGWNPFEVSSHCSLKQTTLKALFVGSQGTARLSMVFIPL